MDALSAPPSEREEIALRRWELLTQLREAGRIDWRSYARLVVNLLVAASTIYWIAAQPFTRVTIFFVVLGAAGAVVSFVFFVIDPLKRRITALEKLLENEIKRPR